MSMDLMLGFSFRPTPEKGAIFGCAAPQHSGRLCGSHTQKVSARSLPSNV